MNLKRKAKGAIKLALSFTGVVCTLAVMAFVNRNPSGFDDGRKTYSGEFAPSEGVVKGPETQTRKEISLNGKWDFQPIYGPYNQQKTKPYGIEATETAADLPAPTADGWDKVPFKVPSAWNANDVFPSYPEKWKTAQMGWLKRKFTVPADWNGKRIIIHFKAVNGDSKIILNGEQVGANFDQTLPFDVDITNKVKKGEANELMVGLRAHSLFDWQGAYGSITAPPGGSRWYGIWQDVSVIATPNVYVDNVYVNPKVSANTLAIQVTLKNTTSQSQTVTIGSDIAEWVNLAGKDSVSAPEVKWRLGNKAITIAPVQATIPAGGETVVNLQARVDGKLKFWDFDNPNLYGAVVSMTDNSGRALDIKYERFGWREFKINGKDVYLNGKKIQFLGDSQHLQNTIYMTRRFAWSYYKLLKDVGANSARLHAVVHPELFHDMADEMGIALLSESSFYASSCNINYDSKLFWKSAQSDVSGMVKAYRNHASIYGWSVENEALPALNVKCKDPVYKQMVYNGIGDLIDICRKTDPSRDWISGDGSRDLDGRAPVFNQHYGTGDQYIREAASTTKPYAVGEAGIAYYASPKISANFVGDRAYRSYKDHSDAIAIDAYELLHAEKGVSAYVSTWNIGFYGVENLPFGMPDTHHIPTKNDGIFLTAPYVEGKPGIQPERIPPYSTQYNPGYQAGMPLYIPLPLYYAAKDVYQSRPSKYDHRTVFQTPAAPVIANRAKEVLFVGKEGSDLFVKLKGAGIPMIMQSASAKVFIVDCSTVTLNAELKQRIKTAVKGGAKAIFWGLTPANQSQIQTALPYTVETFDRPASSLIMNERDNRVSSIPYRDLYFTENADSKTIMQYALKGTFVSKGNTMLRASTVNWANAAGGSSNNGGMMRSEREIPAGPSFVEVKDGKGSYIASTLDLERVSPAHVRMLSQLFKNLGVEVKTVLIRRGSLLDQSAVLNRALVTSFIATNDDEAFSKDFISGETTTKPEYETTTNGSKWNVMEARNGNFRFDQPADAKGNVAYVSFWIQSPQALNQIMTDPNVPQVDFKATFTGGMKLWLNGQEKYASRQAGSNVVIDKLPLLKGWNHFMVKITKGGERWSFNGRLISKNYELLTSMRSAFNPYSDKASFYTIPFNDPEMNFDKNWRLSGDGWHITNVPGSKATFKFYGTGVTLYGKVGPDGGTAKLYIDGKFEQTIDYKKDADPRARIFTKSGFKNSEHTVTVEAINGSVTVGAYDQWESFK
jgi:hypothetical protein